MKALKDPNLVQAPVQALVLVPARDHIGTLVLAQVPVPESYFVPHASQA